MAQVPPARVDKPVALRGSHLLRDFTDVGVKILAEIVEQRSVGKGAYAFKAGESARVPSISGFISKTNTPLTPTALMLIALHYRQDISRGILKPGDRGPAIAVDPLSVCLQFAFIVLKAHTFLFQLIEHR